MPDTTSLYDNNTHVPALAKNNTNNRYITDTPYSDRCCRVIQWLHLHMRPPGNIRIMGQ